MPRIFSCPLAPQVVIVHGGRELVHWNVLIQLGLDLSELHNMLNYIDFFQVFGATCSHDTFFAVKAQAEAETELRQVIVDELAEAGS